MGKCHFHHSLWPQMFVFPGQHHICMVSWVCFFTRPCDCAYAGAPIATSCGSSQQSTHFWGNFCNKMCPRSDCMSLVGPNLHNQSYICYSKGWGILSRSKKHIPTMYILHLQGPEVCVVCTHGHQKQEIVPKNPTESSQIHPLGYSWVAEGLHWGGWYTYFFTSLTLPNMQLNRSSYIYSFTKKCLGIYWMFDAPPYVPLLGYYLQTVILLLSLSNESRVWAFVFWLKHNTRVEIN